MQLGVQVRFHGTRAFYGSEPPGASPAGGSPGGSGRRSRDAGRVESPNLREEVFYLYVTAPGMAARKVSLDRPVTTIGRSSMNDLPISDKMLSRQHARIVRDTDGGLTVEDLGSRNGTFLNGDRLSRDPAPQARRPDHGRRRDAQGGVRVHDARADRGRRRGPSRQHDPQGLRRAAARARHRDGPAAPGRAARQAHRVAAGRQRADGRAPARHLGRRAPRLPHGQGLRDAAARSRPRAPALAGHRASLCRRSCGWPRASRPRTSGSPRRSSPRSSRSATASSSWTRRPARASRSRTRSASRASSPCSPRRSRTRARSWASSTSTAASATAPSRKRTCAC